MERGAGRKKIPIPHLSPPPSQREGGGLGEDSHLNPHLSLEEDWGKDPHLYPPPHVGKLQKNPKRENPLCSLPLEKREDPFHILLLRKRRGLPPPNPPPSFGRGRTKVGEGILSFGLAWLQISIFSQFLNYPI